MVKNSHRGESVALIYLQRCTVRAGKVWRKRQGWTQEMFCDWDLENNFTVIIIIIIMIIIMIITSLN